MCCFGVVEVLDCLEDGIVSDIWLVVWFVNVAIEIGLAMALLGYVVVNRFVAWLGEVFV